MPKAEVAARRGLKGDPQERQIVIPFPFVPKNLLGFGTKRKDIKTFKLPSGEVYQGRSYVDLVDSLSNSPQRGDLKTRETVAPFYEPDWFLIAYSKGCLHRPTTGDILGDVTGPKFKISEIIYDCKYPHRATFLAKLKPMNEEKKS